MSLALSIAVLVLLSLALLFFLAAAVGLLRLPDCYSRAHATGKCDSMGALLGLLALALYNLHHGLDVYNLLTSIKVLLLAVFIYCTAPTATHAIFRSAFLTRLRPWVRQAGPGVVEEEGGA